MNFAKHVKNIFNNKVKALTKNRMDYVKNPNKDFTRKSKLDFSIMINLIVSMGNTAIRGELLTAFNYQIDTPTASAFVQQRNKIEWTAFEYLFHDFNSAFQDNVLVPRLYNGFQLRAFDGSTLAIFPNPDDPDNYQQNKPDIKGHASLHINAFYDLLSKRYEDAIVQSGNHKDERQAMNTMVDRFSGSHNVINIADRGLESYNVFAHIIEADQKFLIRSKDIDSNGVLSGLSLPNEDEFDVDITLILTRKQTKHVKDNPHIYKIISNSTSFDFLTDDQPFYEISFRVVRFKLDDGSFQAVITNLDRDDFPPDEIKKLYNMRWGLETAFRHLKYVVGLIHLHSKKVDSIKQEIFASLILHNFCEIITNNVFVEKKNTKHFYQVNATRAFQICRHFLRLSNKSILPDVEALIAKELLPVKENRSSDRKMGHRKPFSFLYRAI